MAPHTLPTRIDFDPPRSAIASAGSKLRATITYGVFENALAERPLFELPVRVAFDTQESVFVAGRAELHRISAILSAATAT